MRVHGRARRAKLRRVLVRWRSSWPRLAAPSAARRPRDHRTSGDQLHGGRGRPPRRAATPTSRSTSSSATRACRSSAPRTRRRFGSRSPTRCPRDRGKRERFVRGRAGEHRGERTVGAHRSRADNRSSICIGPSDGTHSGPYVPRSAKLRATVETAKPPGSGARNIRCATLKDFTLHLPPGMLGNPTALTACPEHYGWPSRARPRPSSATPGPRCTRASPGTPSSPFPSPSTTSRHSGWSRHGWEPDHLPVAIPPGPFPVTIARPHRGDRGIDSAVIGIPRNLGGFGGTPIEITTVLCARVPTARVTRPRNDLTLNSADYDHDRRHAAVLHQPDLVRDEDVGADARSWRSPSAPTAASVQPDGTNPPLQDSTFTTPITTTGCENVPFDLDFDVDPSAPADGGTTEAGKPSAQDVVLSYPREATCPAESVEPDCWYENEDIWQAQLKDITQSLPEGLRLSPGGGVGLEGCSYEQFGVDSTGKQVNDDPVQCPAGSQIGTLTVRSPVLQDAVGGKVFFGPDHRSRPRDRRQPVEDLPADRGRRPAHQAGRRRDRRRGRQGLERVREPARAALRRAEAAPQGRRPRTAREPGHLRHPQRPRDADRLERQDATTPRRRSTSPATARRPTRTTCRSTRRSRRPSAIRRPPAPTRSRRSSLTRPDGDKNIRNIKLSLPAGAVG